MSTHDLIAAHRRALADVLDGLDDRAWTAQSLCDAWQVRHVAGHLQLSIAVPAPAFAWAMLRHGGFHGASRELSIRIGERPRQEVIDTLRDRASVVRTPPGTPVEAALADLVVHTQDMLVPLRTGMDISPTSWDVAVAFLRSRKGRPHRPAGGLDGLRFAADDLDWSVGDGPAVTGTAADLIVAMYGRSGTLDRLGGDGVAEFRTRF